MRGATTSAAGLERSSWQLFNGFSLATALLLVGSGALNLPPPVLLLGLAAAAVGAALSRPDDRSAAAAGSSAGPVLPSAPLPSEQRACSPGGSAAAGRSA